MIGALTRPDERPADPGHLALALLADHLGAALAHCEALGAVSVPLGESITSGSNGRALLREDRALSQFVHDLRTRELAIGLRLTRACVLAAAVAEHDRGLRPLALLVRSGASILIDAAEDAARSLRDGEADAGNVAYLASRGLLPATAVELPAEGIFSADDTLLVFGLTPLAEVRGFLSGTLISLKAVAGSL